ncbi:MAG: hypothetical protein NDF57_05030 [archaeon GBS-70-058]|nr:hypothetical protein [Candidatus Culexarchaeum nevadense]
MNEWMEYVFSALIIVLLVSLTLTYFIPVSLNRVTYLSEGQLQIEAEKIMNQLLLNPGDPPDWGVSVTSIDSLKSFGFALKGADAYSLDINKLVRVFEPNLSEFTNLTSISLNDILNVLGLYGVYGLSIKLTPVLNVSIQKSSDFIYEVYVKTYDDMPVINARIKAIHVNVYVSGNTEITYLEDVVENVYTDYDGKAILNFTQVDSNGAIGGFLVVYVDFYGLSTVYSFFEGETSFGVIIGNTLYVGHLDEDFNPQNITTKKVKPNNPGGGAIHLCPAALAVTPKALEPTVLFDGKLLPITPQGGARPYYKFELDGLDNDTVALFFVVKNRGSYNICVARRSYNGIEIGLIDYSRRGLMARGVHLRRVVSISGYLYYFDLTLWRLVEG